MNSTRCLKLGFALLVGGVMARPLASQDSHRLPPLEEVVESRADVWGEAAMAEPNGASYEFFRDLLPPPRYVNADFRYYPLVLSPPRSRVKARLISNGSGVNLRGGTRSWKDVGTPVTFRVGPDEFRFGDLQDRLSDPTLAEGYLPIYAIDYRHAYPVHSEGAVPLRQTAVARADEVYRLEAFASTDPQFYQSGLVWVRFSLSAGVKGLISLDVDADGARFDDGVLRDADGRAIVCCDKSWKWNRGLLSAQLASGNSAVVAIATEALPDERRVQCDEAAYQRERNRARATWDEILSHAIHVEVPEPLVQNAWRNLLIQNFSLLSDSRLFYSAGNQYEQLYEAEGSEAALAMLLWGYDREMRKMLPPLLDFQRKGLPSHIASQKLQNIANYYWLTRDTQSIAAWRDKWQPALDHLLTQRDPASGLLPKERYCGDISTPVHSLSVEAKAWRAVHDMAWVLGALGDQTQAERCRVAAAETQRVLRSTVGKSARSETSPPFVPIALLDDEPIHDPITEVRIGSYWNIIMPYVIGSRIFPTGSDEEQWIPRYVEQHGGLCMGMTRSGGTAHAFWTGRHRVNPLYGNRYVTDVWRRDDVERGLVSFYGMLAQGFTRNTFIVGEGSTLQPVDDGGRFFYCPPNTAGNGHFLTMLRNLLIQDWDSDDDGQPDTLRLMAATPRQWLDDGQVIQFQSAPTAFGPVSCTMASRLADGEIVAEVNLPDMNREPATSILLRARVPAGYRCVGAHCNGKAIVVDGQGSVELAGQRGDLRVVFDVVKDSSP